MVSNTNHYLIQGQYYEATVVVRGVNLTNASIVSQIRREATSATAYPFTIDKVNAENGILKFSIPPDITSTMKPGRYVYDAFYLTDSNPIPFQSGIVVVNPRVTQTLPSGPPSVYIQQNEVYSNYTVYRARAVAGSLDTDPVWRIERVSIEYGASVTTTTEYPNGSVGYAFVWADRHKYNYSTN